MLIHNVTVAAPGDVEVLMATVNLTSEFGLVVRRAALEQRGVSYRKLLDTMEVEAPLDVSDDLISFGPHFGSEAATEFVRRLGVLGLVNIDDFFVFTGDFPEWCGFTASLKLSFVPLDERLKRV